jgi:tetratricopeptide (TPR) repeat protein
MWNSARIFLKALLLVVFVIASVAMASGKDQQAPVVSTAASERLDTLFARLKKERHPGQAERLSKKIWANWARSGSASIDLLSGWAREAIANDKFSVALDLLDQVTTLHPDFAEGWNQRATLHFMMKNYGKSMRDIERVLVLEPRHYGALSGLGLIFQELDDKKQALAAWYKVLALYPAMQSAQKAVIKLEEDISAKGI